MTTLNIEKYLNKSCLIKSIKPNIQKLSLTKLVKSYIQLVEKYRTSTYAWWISALVFSSASSSSCGRQVKTMPCYKPLTAYRQESGNLKTQKANGAKIKCGANINAQTQCVNTSTQAYHRHELRLPQASMAIKHRRKTNL